jgi:hypothetical protein
VAPPEASPARLPSAAGAAWPSAGVALTAAGVALLAAVGGASLDKRAPSLSSEWV